MTTSPRTLLRRREFLRVGAIGAGLTLSNYLRFAAADQLAPAKARSGILVFLKGGPSHQDTFDMKPGAPAEYRGQFSPIKTNAPGVEVCEHLPRLARCADQYAVIRGITHNLADHGLGTQYLMTGNRPIPLLRFPEYGCVVSKEHSCDPDLPPYVSVDRPLHGPGYLGIQYGPLCTGEKPRPNRPFNVRGVTLDGSLSVSHYSKRRALLDDLDTAFRGFESQDDQVRSLDQFSQQAYQIISSPRARAAFDLEKESPQIAQRFGNHEFSQSFLLACRLVEAGVRFVTIIVEDWDTHNDNFRTLKDNLLPGLDQGLSAMLATLKDKGLLDSTAILVTGEFGRTPKVNGGGGRDHWARAMTSLLAGGAVHGGQAIGASDDKAAEPAGDAFSPDDVAATFYRNLGIDPKTEYDSNAGRPITLIHDGAAIEQVFTG